MDKRQKAALDHLLLEMDAEIGAARLVLEQIVAGLLLRDPGPIKALERLFESISVRLDATDEAPRTPYGEKLWAMTRVKLDSFVGPIAKLLTKSASGPSPNP